MEYIYSNLEHFILTQLNVEARKKSLGTSRHVGNAPLSLGEVKRIISFIKQDLKGQGYTKAECACAYASVLKNTSYLRQADQKQLTSYFRSLDNPVSELIRKIAAGGWEKEDINAERKGFGNSLFVALALLTFRDWERYHGHHWDLEGQYIVWLARLYPDEFNVGASIALQAHHELGFSLLATMKGKVPLPWHCEGKGGQS